MQKILITGGAGFIGRHLSRFLLNLNYQISVYDNFSSSSAETFDSEFSGKIRLFSGDILDKAGLNAAINQTSPDAIIHLAARVSVQESIQSPEETYRVNIEGTENVIEAANQVSLKKLVFASSAAVYGNQEPPLAEDFAVFNNSEYKNSLLSPYAVSKLNGEELISESSLKGVIFRMFNVYGPDQNISGGYAAVIPEFISRIKQQQSIDIHGDGNQTRDFIFIEDVVRAFHLAIENETAEGTYNLASGKETSILNLISALEKIYSEKLKSNFKPERIGDIKHSYADISKIQREIGFIPETSLEEGLKKIAGYERKQT